MIKLSRLMIKFLGNLMTEILSMIKYCYAKFYNGFSMKRFTQVS